MMLTASCLKLTMTKTHTKTNTKTKKRENFQEERVHVQRHSYSVLQCILGYIRVLHSLLCLVPFNLLKDPAPASGAHSSCTFWASTRSACGPLAPPPPPAAGWWQSNCCLSHPIIISTSVSPIRKIRLHIRASAKLRSLFLCFWVGQCHPICSTSKALDNLGGSTDMIKTQYTADNRGHEGDGGDI